MELTKLAKNYDYLINFNNNKLRYKKVANHFTSFLSIWRNIINK